MIELSQVIRELRTELYEAIATATGQDLRFEVGPIELELTVAITRETAGGTKIKFWVVDADASGKAGTVTTQRVKLSLEPKLGPGDRRPEVSGRAGERER
ncbi:trypco2 family protein [Catenulispora subtropica]|uniref:Trypsin-co-occurring domain-containing protein n=1 Tax=Catenulispora subtropica TaxID=450798 RepID=A0ABP5DWI3_9ACTN